MSRNSISWHRIAIVVTLFATLLAAQGPEPVVRTIRGTVHGLGDARVRVTLWHNDMVRLSIEPIAECFAADDGTFTFRGVSWFQKQQWGYHKAVLVARCKGRVALLEVRGDNAAIDKLRLDLVETGDMHGTLIDADSNQPISNGWIWPAIFEGKKQVWLTMPMLPWHAQSDERGRFVIKGLPKGRVIKMLAGGDDHERTWIPTGATDRGTANKPIDVLLRRGGRIRGKVLMPDGKPAVRVLVQTTGRGAGYGHTMTNDDGEFTLTALAEDIYKVYAKVPDLTVVAVTNLLVAPGTVSEDHVVQLVHGGFIVGRIVDQATGKPFVPGPSTDVAMYGPARGNGGSCQTTPVLADGTFRIRAPAGKNRIYLRSAGHGYSEPSEYVEVTEGEETKVEWQLKKPRRLGKGKK